MAGDGHALVQYDIGMCGPAEARAGVTGLAIFEPETGALTEAQPPWPVGFTGAMTTVAGGRVLVTGIADQAGGAYPGTWIWDPATHAWTRSTDMAVARAWPDVLTLGDGRVLAVGSEYASMDLDSPVSFAEMFDPITSEWKPASTPPADFDAEIADVVGLAGGEVLVVQDSIDEGVSVFVYEPAQDVWARLPAPDLESRPHTLLALPDGSALGVGGWGSRDVWRYDPGTGWSVVGRSRAERGFAVATVLRDGRLLIAGGEVEDPPRYMRTIRSAELFDPASGRAAKLASMPTGRTQGSAATLQDDSALIVGGWAAYGGEDDEVAQCPKPSERAVRWIPSR